MFRRLLTTLLSKETGCEVRQAHGGAEAIDAAELWRPDLVILDISMPRLDGFAACHALKQGKLKPAPQVMMVSAHSTLEEQVKAFSAGADDYLVKPIDHLEFRSRVHLHFRLREAQAVVKRSQRKLRKRHAELQRLTSERSREMLATQDIAIFTLAKVAESRDNETGMHLTRMREYSQLLACDLRDRSPYADQIDNTFLDDLYRSSPLHDIGKVGIPDAVLLKPGRLTVEEFEIMKQHASIGANILQQAVKQSASGSFLAMAALIAQSHHERWDGTGYPRGLAGADIPLPGRIVAVADVFDALTSKRPYKEPWPAEKAAQYIEEQSGSHFDPVIVDAFRRVLPRFLDVHRSCGDDGSSLMSMLQTATALNSADVTTYIERAMAFTTDVPAFMSRTPDIVMI
ncbi:MAG: response regulator [Planctomycetes bacterium]|nr:response regulator [Planctomycetota bacterium]